MRDAATRSLETVTPICTDNSLFIGWGIACTSNISCSKTACIRDGGEGREKDQQREREREREREKEREH